MTIDNRQRFKLGPHAKAWSDITASEAFVEAVNTAMLITVAQQKADAESSTRLEGARHFLGNLCNLTTEIQTPKLQDQNLKTNI